MAKQIIDIGVQGNDGTGDSIRESFRKVNENFNEIYSIFGAGGTIKFTNLDDAPSSYGVNQLIMSNTTGTSLTARSIIAGAGIDINKSSNSQLVISADVANLAGDASPQLGGALNTNHFAIGKLSDPSPELVNAFNIAWPNSTTTIDELPVTLGYANRTYVKTSESGFVSGPLRVRNEPIEANTTDKDYDSSLSGNYLSSEVMPRKDTVRRTGDTMAGKLYLNDHPAPLDGYGTPTGANDLQAATKFYVDNTTFTSNVNLFVSTSGDDLQLKSPAGKEGRFWQYAYKSVGAAALQAENLINLSSNEPGPYKQRISYTTGHDQTFSTIQSVTLTGGNSANAGYTNAYDLLQSNKEFIQRETIAYINKKYVNKFDYDKPKYKLNIQTILDAIGYDIVLDTTYNSYRIAASYFDEANTEVLTNQLIQTIDAIKYTKEQLVNYSYSTINLQSYIDNVINALCFDFAFQSNYQSVQVGILFESANTNLNKSEINAVLLDLKSKLIVLPSVLMSPQIVSSINDNINIILDIIVSGTIPNVKMPSNKGTTTGKTSAKDLLLNNISFIQAEIIGFLSAEFPTVIYDKPTVRQDIKHIVWSITYDLLYGGNTQSIYAGTHYLLTSIQNAPHDKSAAIHAAIGYINTLAQIIIINGSLPLVYQQSVKQYKNETFNNGSDASVSISQNISIIQNIVELNTNYTIIPPSISSIGTILTNARTEILNKKSSYKNEAVDYVNNNFAVINNLAITSKITNLFDIIINTLTTGIGILSSPIFISPSTLSSGYENARQAIIANINFITDETVAWVTSAYPNFDYNGNPVTGQATCKRDIKYILEAIAYDITYGGNSASIHAAKKYWSNNVTVIPNEQITTILAIGHIQTMVALLSQNITVTPTFSSTPQVRNTAWSNGSDASATITELFTIIKDIIETNSEYNVQYPSLTNYDSVLTSTRQLILDTKETVSVNTIQYLDTTFTGSFNYDESSCFRDIGLIVDAMAIDLVTGGTWQSINAGKSYYKNASSHAIAIGTQFSETIDGIEFVKGLGLQVLTQTTASRYQTLFTQTFDSVNHASINANDTFIYNMETITNIIKFGVGAAPTPTFGSGIWNIVIDNGGNGYVDQGSPLNNDIIPAKALIGTDSLAYSSIVKYIPESAPGVDTIQVRMTKPGLYTVGEQVEFGETVRDLNITIFVESGVYYEDYPIRLPANCSIKGDDIRRTIIRPRDRVSQSPWRKIFFYRDAIVDAMEVGVVNYTGPNYAPNTNITLSGSSEKIIVTLANGQASSTWIGKVITDNNIVKRGKAIIDSVSGNFMNCSVIYPFSTIGVLNTGDWFIYDSINYGRHYLTNPLDITSPSKNNKDIDVFLCNDATRISNITFQGHGGFAMVLDPGGQIKTKSPYGQDCSSFTQSTNKKRFAGGQYVDGFAGRLTGTITDIADNGITLTVVGGPNSGLDIRPPHPPCAFYVQGQRYQVDDIVSFDASTATVVMTLNVATPYNAADSYNNSKCSRDVGLIIDAIGYDMVLGSNFQSVKAGLSYLRSYSNTVINRQKIQTIAGINKAKELANATSSNSSVQSAINDRMNIIMSIIEHGITSIPAITYPTPVGASEDSVKAKDILVANRKFIQTEITAWISSNYAVKLIPNYNALTCQRDVGYILDAMVYDLFYGGNSQTRDSAEAYWRISGTATSYIIGEESVTIAAYTRLKTIIQSIVAGTSITKSSGNTRTQVTDNPPTNPSSFNTILSSLSDILIDYIPDHSYTSGTADYPTITQQSSSLQTARTAILTAKPTIQSSVISFLNSGGGLKINIEMGGNKSMIANDFAMINDLGYAIIATNGAVSEQMSTFSYYCHTHFWANNGGQIRAIAGSNSHGKYGLRASGYDVTELPDSVTLANNLIQTARIYKQGVVSNEMTPTATTQSLALWIIGYEYEPLNGCEVEIDHTVFNGGISRYEANSIEHTNITISGQNVLKLYLNTSGNNGTSTTGLHTELYHGQLVIIRSLRNVKFNNISNVQPTRPSTALQYSDKLADIYRVTSYHLTNSTGEVLPNNVAILQSDTAFDYFKITTDISNINTVDPSDPSKTQGSTVGDTKIAVLHISQQSTIDQLNKGTYITAWNGRLHRILGYVSPEVIATADVVSGNTNSTAVIVNNVIGVIEVGDVVNCIGITNGQTVTNISYNSDTQQTTVTLSAAPTAIPSGNITFGIASNGYIDIDPTAIINNAGDGSGVSALTFKNKTSSPGNTLYKLVTFDIPYNRHQLYPPVDSYITISNQTTDGFNRSAQVVDVTSNTQLTVTTTSGLLIGMTVTISSTAVTVSGGFGTTILTVNSVNGGIQIGDYVRGTGFDETQYVTGVSTIDTTTTITLNTPPVTSPSGTLTFVSANRSIIQSIDDANKFTVSPACWVPSGCTVNASVVTSVKNITITNGGTGYTLPPIITFIGGGAEINAIATCTISNGSIDTVTLVSPGYNYTSTPSIQLSYGDAVLTAELTDNVNVAGTASVGVSTATITTLYQADPGDFIIGTQRTASGVVSKSGDGPYSITLSFTSTTAPAINKFYRVSGNSNSLYNGFWNCSASTSTSITLEYPLDPGTFATGITHITEEGTTAISSVIGISKPFDSVTATVLRAGYTSGASAQITTRISSCRATNHDFLDIGTGSYSTTNYPYQIYGNPAISRQSENEIQEDGVGRCFYTSTDQNGVFRVGRYFTVDQGTGTVTLSTNIALSNVDGLGFKRGVVVSEFSSDTSMTNNTPDVIPVQSAIRGYIDKRLGIDHNNQPILQTDLIGAGYLALDGSLSMKSALNMGKFKITNLATPTASTDAATKLYVDHAISGNEQIFSGVIGDVLFTYNDTGIVVTSAIGANKVVNSMISPTAAIQQSKLSLNYATTRLNATGITSSDLGIASFDTANFTITNGWVGIKPNSITKSQMAPIGNGSILGNFSGIAANPIEVTAGTVVTQGDGIKNTAFTASGLMTVAYDGSNTLNNAYSVTLTTTTGQANRIVKTGANGEIDVSQLKIDNYKIIDTSTGPLTVTFTTPGGYDFLSASGTTGSNTTVISTCSMDFTGGTVKVRDFTTGATSTTGTITGHWIIGSSSQVDFTNGILKTTTLTTGAAATSGTITGNWILSPGSKMQATYADLAEYYEGDFDYAPGTVMVFGGDKEVTNASTINDTRLAGVVTTNPAYVLNAEQSGIKVCIALIGRTPCKVIGKIKKGDLLTTSNTPGYAIKAADPKLGSIIGKALEDKDTGEAGVIEIAVGRA